MCKVLVTLLSVTFALIVNRQVEARKIVKVGVILTYSGPYASLGEQVDRAFELYMKLHKQDLPPGVEVPLPMSASLPCKRESAKLALAPGGRAWGQEYLTA